MTGVPPVSIVAPTGRKHLAADALLRLVHKRFDTLPDQPLPETAMSCTEALLSACAMVSLPSPSLLAFDTARAAGHVAPIDGIERVPCDTHRRARRAPVFPASLRPVFTSVFTQ